MKSIYEGPVNGAIYIYWWG